MQATAMDEGSEDRLAGESLEGLAGLAARVSETQGQPMLRIGGLDGFRLDEGQLPPGRLTIPPAVG